MYTIPEPDVQISVDQILAASVFQLTTLLAGATERANELEVRNERQTQAIESDEEAMAAQRAALKASGDQIREMAKKINELDFEVETLNNALAIRGRTIGHQADLIHKLEQAKALGKPAQPKVGDRVRVLEDPTWTVNGAVQHHWGMHGNRRALLPAGIEGEVLEVGVYSPDNLVSVRFPDGEEYVFTPDSLEVVA